MVATSIYGTVLFLIGATLFASTFSGEYDQGELFPGEVSTVFVPRIFLVAWMLFSALMIIERWASKSRFHWPAVDWPSLGIACALAALIGVAMLNVGFVLALVPGVFLFAWARGYRKLGVLAATSLLLPAAVWILFIDVFELALPRSPWFEAF